MKNVWLLLLSLSILCIGCGRSENDFDASGTFEADEVIVSSELGGKIINLDIEEGDAISENKIVGVVDAENIALQKQQVEATIAALQQKTLDVNPQVQLLKEQLTVQESQLANLQHEKARIENLIKADAATGKQLDDINAQIDVATKQIKVTEQQINVQRNNISSQNRAMLSESKPLQSRIDQLNDQIEKANIVNPVSGTVTTKYAMTGEITSPGKALYKVANLSILYLRAYITGSQLSEVKLGQHVKIFVDKGEEDYKEYEGIITWISEKAEFTPKTIQTKEERANLVYAMKIKVKNDGYLKIGMYGEIKLK